MSSGTIKMVSKDMRSSIIRVVHYDNKNFEGTFYNLYYGIEIPFENLTRLLFLMEDLMNELDYPQASMKGKRFGIEEKLSKRDSIQKQHSIAKQDTLATFKIKVLFRQGASWQGKIHWLEENLETTFRSVLELVKLMDSALPSQSCCLIGLDEAEAANSVAANGVTVKLFDYDNKINNDKNRIQGYNFFDYSGGSIDGKGITTGTYNPVMLPTLVNGYPGTERGSMSYLFNDTYLVNAVTNGGGLFQKDAEGHYYYDSAQNAAYFDGNSFTLYDWIVYPSYVNKNNTAIQRSNFLPFDKVTNSTATQQGTINGIPAMQLKDKVNLWFGMVVEFEFLMPKDGMVDGKPMVFDFLGDDDVFVYIDDVLVLDIGGTHEAQSGTINFVTGAADSPKKQDTNLKAIFQAAGKDVSGFDGNTFADYTVHTLKFFYLERGGTYSYCKLQFNMPTLPEKSLTVEKQLTVDASSEVKDFLEGALDYSFRVLKDDGSVAVPQGSEFVIKQDGKADADGTVGKDGFFTLKAGQKAEFANMSQYVDIVNGETYYVQEVLPEDLRGQYGTIEYVLNGEGGETQTEQNPPVGFEGFLTERLSADQSQYVIYQNAVDTNELSFLQITKEIKDPATSSFDEDQIFRMQVKIDGILLSDGTPYTVGNKNKTTENGIVELKAGQRTYIATGMLSGTTFEVTELEVANSNVSYSATINDSAIGITTSADKVTGTFALNSVAKVVVENESTIINLPVVKIWEDNDNQDGKRPAEITENLLANGKEVASQVVTGTGDTWNYEFTNLPKYENGVVINYSVTEDAVAGYETAIEDLFRDGEKFDEITLAPGITEYKFENLES